jgi:hypothetical protein
LPGPPEIAAQLTKFIDQLRLANQRRTPSLNPSQSDGRDGPFNRSSSSSRSTEAHSLRQQLKQHSISDDSRHAKTQFHLDIRLIPERSCRSFVAFRERLMHP